MSGYFRKDKPAAIPVAAAQLLGGVPFDLGENQMRVFAFSRWMSWDEWILARVEALGRENLPPPAPAPKVKPDLRSMFGQPDFKILQTGEEKRKKNKSSARDKEESGDLLCALEGDTGGFDEREKSAKKKRKTIKN